MPDTLTLPIEGWPNYEPDQKRVITEFESGKVKFKAIQSQTYKDHIQVIPGLTTSQKETLQAFTDGHMVEYFKFTPPGGAEGNYMFSEPARFHQRAANYWEATLHLREIPI